VSAAKAIEIEPHFAEEARKRQATSTGGRNPQLVENVPQAAAKSRDQAAAAVGLSGKRTDLLGKCPIRLWKMSHNLSHDPATRSYFARMRGEGCWQELRLTLRKKYRRVQITCGKSPSSFRRAEAKKRQDARTDLKENVPTSVCRCGKCTTTGAGALKACPRARVTVFCCKSADCTFAH
jgi:hypothetical protein